MAISRAAAEDGSAGGDEQVTVSSVAIGITAASGLSRPW